jgi:hypothetical protein
VESLRSIAGEINSFCDLLDSEAVDSITESISAAAAYRQELLAYEDISAETLYQLDVRIADEPGVLSRVMTALGNASINVEDLALHHFSRSVGGELVIYVSGEDTAMLAANLLSSLGYPAVISFAGSQ